MADVFITDIEQISEIDDSVEFVGDNGAKTYSVPASLLKKYTNKGLVNPNLLDNWFFDNPVNQRGTTGGSTVYNTYSIDRWKWDYAGGIGSFELASNGIKLIPASGTTLIFRQMFEKPELLDGKILTCSVLLVTGELFSGTITRKNGTSQTFFNVPSRFYTTLGVSNGFQILLVREETVLAVKLELGDTQTLAHQENGKWVLNEIPNYADQLARCQRYLYVCNREGQTYSAFGGTNAFNENTLYPTMSIPVSMRTTPSVVFSGGWCVQNGNTYLTTITNARIYRANDLCVTLVMNVSGLTQGAYYHLNSYTDATARIILSAEL